MMPNPSIEGMPCGCAVKPPLMSHARLHDPNTQFVLRDLKTSRTERHSPKHCRQPAGSKFIAKPIAPKAGVEMVVSHPRAMLKMLLMRSTRLSQTIQAPREAVYRALINPHAIRQWMVPDGMRSEIHEFEAREGGAFRISRTYDEPTATGKSSAHTTPTTAALSSSCRTKRWSRPWRSKPMTRRCRAR